MHAKDISFTPATLKAHRGDTVRWSFEDVHVSHNVTSVGKQRFRSSHDQLDGTTYAVRFTKAGTYRYECTIHVGMTGKIVVR